MKITKILAFALAATLLALGVSVGLRHGSDIGSVTTDSATASNSISPSVKDLAASSKRSQLESLPRQGQKAFEGISSYAALQDRLASIDMTAAQKAEHLRIAAIYCETRASVAPHKVIDQPTRSDLIYSAYSDSFCKDFNGRSDDQLALILGDPNSDVAMAQVLVADENAIHSEESRAVAENILLSSHEPSAVTTAAGILSMAPEGSWKLGNDLAKSAQEINSLPEARWLAAQMVACELSGGCGPGGFYSMTQCANYQACTPGASLDEIWRKNTAQPVYRLATEIREELLKSRM